MKFSYSYKILRFTSGIYKITNLINSKVYIGSATCLYTRFYNHKKDLKNNKHCNQHLQNSVNKYNLDNFEFSIIEICDKKELATKEQFYIDSIKPEYNICKVARSSLGYKHSEETKTKMKKPKSLQGRLNMKVPKPNSCKPILQYDLQGTFIREWSSIREANLKYGNIEKCSGISKVCSGKLKSRYGYNWKYKEK